MSSEVKILHQKLLFVARKLEHTLAYLNILLTVENQDRIAMKEKGMLQCKVCRAYLRPNIFKKMNK